MFALTSTNVQIILVQEILFVRIPLALTHARVQMAICRKTTCVSVSDNNSVYVNKQ